MSRLTPDSVSLALLASAQLRRSRSAPLAFSTEQLVDIRTRCIDILMRSEERLVRAQAIVAEAWTEAWALPQGADLRR